MKVWICAIAKIEELYIREWINWHKNIGIDHIIIGDNNDSNYDKPIQPIIQDYIDEGYIELINLNDKLACQKQFYNDVYQKYKDSFDWISFIDIDEFIELPAYNNDVHYFLSDNKFDNYDAIILPWLIFTDNNKLYYEDLPVQERFTTTFLKDKIGIKYFIKSLTIISRIVSRHNPGRNKCIDNYKIKYCDSSGDTNIEPIIKKGINNPENFTQIKIKNELYNYGYISHYLTKSTEEYIKYKMLRGRVAGIIGNYKIRYTIQFYFDINSYNEEKIKLFNSYSKEINEEIKNQLIKYQTDINGKNINIFK